MPSCSPYSVNTECVQIQFLINILCLKRGKPLVMSLIKSRVLVVMLVSVVIVRAISRKNPAISASLAFLNWFMILIPLQNISWGGAPWNVPQTQDGGHNSKYGSDKSNKINCSDKIRIPNLYKSEKEGNRETNYLRYQWFEWWQLDNDVLARRGRRSTLKDIYLDRQRKGHCRKWKNPWAEEWVQRRKGRTWRS